MDLVKSLPKAEVHLHLAGSFLCETVYSIADRNLFIPSLSKSEYQLTQSNFSCLNDLLSLIYLNLSVVQSEQDLFDLTVSALSNFQSQNVVYIEPSINIRMFSHQFLSPSQITRVLSSAASEVQSNSNVQINWILEFSRCLPVDLQVNTLNSISAYNSNFIGVGIAENEYQGPSKGFEKLFDLARNLGFCGKEGKNVTAHTGEETPAEYIQETLQYLKPFRIDHGVRAYEDQGLMKILGEKAFPIAMAPISNKKLKVLDRFCQGVHVFSEFVKCGCTVSINSDDPGAFNQGINENFQEFYDEYQGDDKDLVMVELVKNGFKSAFMPDSEKQAWIQEIERKVKLN